MTPAPLNRPVDNPEYRATALAADPFAPTPHQRAGGVSRSSAAFMMVAAIIGAAASALLWKAELGFDPLVSNQLACDLNAVVKCSSSLGSWQSHVFGVSNALLGTLSFATLAVIALALFLGVRLPVWLWWGLWAGLSGGVGLALWFMHQSVYFFAALCPYCMVVWIVTLALWVHVTARQIQVTPALYRVARPFVVLRWAILAIIYLGVALFIFQGLSDQIIAIFS